MEKDGFIELVGEDNFRNNIVEAMEYAKELIK